MIFVNFSNNKKCAVISNKPIIDLDGNTFNQYNSEMLTLSGGSEYDPLVGSYYAANPNNISVYATHIFFANLCGGINNVPSENEDEEPSETIIKTDPIDYYTFIHNNYLLYLNNKEDFLYADWENDWESKNSIITQTNSVTGLADLFEYFDLHFVEESKTIVIMCKQSVIDDLKKHNVDSYYFSVKFAGYTNSVVGKIHSSLVPKYDDLIVVSLNFPTNNVEENKFIPINSEYDSFMLIRTNPKLTGNIKLVVDSHDGIYLDTIKVPSLSILNETKYRHFPISDEGDYARDVKYAFRTLPAGVLFNPGENTKNPYNVYTDINDNYETLYEYGAETNDDLLYDESLKIFAPLYIGKTLPKYFCIFRNIPVSHDNLNFDNDEELKSLIKKSEIVKIFDLRPHTSIGNYLNSYYNEISQCNPEMCNLSFIDQEHKGDITHVGRNSWFGVDVNKGVLTNKVETTYFATEIIDEQTQDDLNMFLLGGFERNNLLYPRILNLEFMFNDDSAEEYKIYNYFGLYLSENEIFHFNQVYTDFRENDKKVYIDEDNEVFDIYDVKYNLNIIADEKFDDRLFFATSPNDVANIANLNELLIFINNNVCDKPLKSICNIDGDMIIPEDGVKSFMSIYFSKQLTAGEHIKFICQPESGLVDEFNAYDTSATDDKNIPPVIFEIIMSNDQHLRNTKYNISPRIMTNNKLDDTDSNKAYGQYYRMTCYVDDVDGGLAQLSEQIERIKHCINKFNSPYLHIESTNSNSIGLTSTLFDVEVQHIMSNIPTDKDVIEDIVDPLKFFNKTFDNEILIIDELLDDVDSYYTNFGFDIIRNRYYTKEKFRNLTFGKYYQIADDLKDKLNNVKYPIVRTINGYNALQNIDNDEITVISPFNVDMYMIHSPYMIESMNGYINVCEPVSASVSIMGIHAVKDFEMNEHVAKSTTVKQSQIIEFEPDEDIELETGIIYKLLEGELKSLKHLENTCIVRNGDAYSYQTNNETGETEVITTRKIQAGTNVSLLKMITNESNHNIQKTVFPAINFINYYSSNKSLLSVPIVPLVNFSWKTSSQYFDKNNYLNIDLLRSSEYVDGEFNKIFSTFDFTSQNALRKFIVENNIQTALCHYNAYINKLTFVYYGVQFTWSINNKGTVNMVNLQKLNNYEIAIVNNNNSDFTNNVYISDSEKLIILEIHSYDVWNQVRLNNVTYVEKNTMEYNDYNIFELPYHYNIETSAINSNVLDITKLETLDDNETAFYGFYQKSSPGELSWEIIGTTLFVEYDKIHNEDPYMYNVIVKTTHETFDVSKMSKEQLKNFVHIVSERLHSDFIHDADKHLYAIRILSNITIDDIKKLISGFDMNSFVFNYVDDNTYGVTYKKNTIRCSTKSTENIKYLNDNFIPAYKNIIDFYDYDAEIDNELDGYVDSFGLNTKIRHINLIEGYTCNKVLDNDAFTYDKSNDEHNYYSFDRSVLQMPTDAGIYRVYSDNDEYEFYSGYANGVRDKMMFASQCILLKSDITVDNYLKSYVSCSFTTSLFNEGDEATQELEIVINVTEHFMKHFTSNNTFMSNFTGLQKYDINNYILNTITSYYDFDNIEIEVYGKFNDSKIKKQKRGSLRYLIISRPKDDEFILYELLTNYKTNCIIDNDNVMLTITIPYNKLYTYYPIIKINRL